MGKEQRESKAFLDRLIDALLNQLWHGILKDVWPIVREFLHRHYPNGPYGVLEYESTLEPLDPERKPAIFRKRDEIRYLQDNIIAYQDQAWGDGEILVESTEHQGHSGPDRQAGPGQRDARELTPGSYCELP